MKKLFLPTLLVLHAAAALAQAKSDEHTAHHPANAASAPASMTEGVVRKIDKAAQKITIQHGEIKSLDMPPMTMVFQLNDPAWLETFKVGDAIRFSVAKTAGGKLTVSAMQRAP